jgi:hypothetical protein
MVAGTDKDDTFAACDPVDLFSECIVHLDDIVAVRMG